MSYLIMKERFLNVAQYSRYRSELNNFEKCSPFNNENFPVGYLENFRINDFMDSLKILINNEQYRTKSIALKYMTVIAQFFRYCIRNEFFSNPAFLQNINAPTEDEESSYLYTVTSYIRNQDVLSSVSQRDPLNEDEFDTIVGYVNGFFDYVDPQSSLFDKYATLLGIKLMLFTGVKFGTLPRVALTDIDLDQNLININGFQIRMPLKFNQQLRLYLQIRPVSNSDRLFLQSNCSPWDGNSPTSSKIRETIDSVLFRTDTTGLTKYGIRQLLLAGTDIQIIKELTLAGNEIINGCGTANELLFDDQLRNIYLARQLAKTDTYFQC